MSNVWKRPSAEIGYRRIVTSSFILRKVEFGGRYVPITAHKSL
jgi:hypothetical protein